MMSANSGADEPTSSPVLTMDAKLMVATDCGDVQQLKDLVNKEGFMRMVVMAKQAASTTKPHLAFMNPQLLALASSGYSQGLESLLDGEDGQASVNGMDVSMQRASHDIEAKGSLLEGVTAEGDTALHVVATYRQGFTYGDRNNFLESAGIIYCKAKHLLFVPNKEGDTPLHCAARAKKSDMVSCLIDLAKGENRVKELLRKENKRKETALHEAVRVGNNDTVKRLMEEDSELASFPEDGASPLYLAIVLKWDLIVETLYDNSDKEKLSYSGQNGQNALHAAVLRRPAILRRPDLLTEKLLRWNKDLTTQRDKNGSTPLHFAAAGQSGPWADRPSVDVCQRVLDANKYALYQPDHAGLFPIHVAASVGALGNVQMFVSNRPGYAGLRDAKGKTFLHVAVEKQKLSIVKYACENRPLSWIMNMQDDDGNTALHLAVDAGSLRMFCFLLGNRQVNLNLINNEGETPLDIAHSKIPQGLYFTQNSEALIYRELGFVGAMKGVHREDHFEDNNTRRAKDDGSKITEVLKDLTQTLCIGSVLIASVTFGATFAVPGGYIADDHNNGGTPIFARRYAFDAFVVSNTLAFIFSAMATVALMYSGSPAHSPEIRTIHICIAQYSLSLSVKSLAAAFALGAYVVLAPVAHKTAVATCVLSCFVLLYENLDYMWRHLILLARLRKRKGPIRALVQFSVIVVGNFLLSFWPLIFIFGWAAYASPAPKMKPPVQAPLP